MCSGLQSWGQLRGGLKGELEESEIPRARPPHVEKVMLAFPTSIRPHRDVLWPLLSGNSRAIRWFPSSEGAQCPGAALPAEGMGEEGPCMQHSLSPRVPPTGAAHGHETLCCRPLGPQAWLSLEGNSSQPLPGGPCA